jgi:Raf kinase inhibitor-like YbhB/YbcL family protein
VCPWIAIKEKIMRNTTRMLALAAGLTCSAAALAGGFTLSSPAFKAGGMLGQTEEFAGFGCTGSNISPALNWSGAPAGTRSFALTLYDPDAPTGSGWWHWVVFNLPADAKGLSAGAGDAAKALLPAGALQSRTDFGKPGYGGPCPPVGDKPHHYIFTVFALKTDKLPLEADAPAAMVGYYLNQQKLGTATLTGLFGR